jgi:hypothetical protein
MSILVNLSIWPMMRLRAIPARNPTSIGLDRKFARKPSRSAPAAKQNKPTTTVSARVSSTRPAWSTPAAASTPASMMQVAVSGPTITCLDGPNRAYPTREKIVANSPVSIGKPAIAG